MATYKMQSGYAFKLDPDEESWEYAPNDSWEIDIYGEPTGREHFLDVINIDGAPCAVFETPDGVWAQTVVMTRVNALSTRQQRINEITTVESALPAQVSGHAGALALGVVGLAVLGAAGYFALRNKGFAPPAGAAPAALKAPTPAPAPSHAAPAHSAPVTHVSAPVAHVATPAVFSVGQHVQAQWTNGNWYPGQIKSIDGSGRYEIAWDDGSSSTWDSPAQVRTGAAASPAGTMHATTGTMQMPSPEAAKAQALGDCVLKGGDQIDEQGDCWKGDERVT